MAGITNPCCHTININDGMKQICTFCWALLSVFGVFLKNQLLIGVCFNLGYEKCEIREPIKPFPFRKGISHLVTDS